MSVTYNENIELSVISVVLKNKESYQVIQDIVKKDYFWWRPFSYAWKCFENLSNEQLGIDSISLENELDRNGWLSDFAILSSGLSGKEAIDFIFSFNTNNENAETYAYELVESYSSRKLNDIFEKEKAAIQKGVRVKEVLSDLDLETGKVSTMVGAKSSNITTASEAVIVAMEGTVNAMNGMGTIIPTGLNFIDYYTGGLGRQRLIEIGGSTGDGKTALGSSLINKMTIENKKVHPMGWISLEMDVRECINRIISNQTGISTKRLDMGQIKNDELKLYKHWCDKIKDAPMFIDDTINMTYPLLKTKVRKFAELGCVSVLIDQLDLIIPPSHLLSAPKHEKMNAGAYFIKSLAREFDINIVLLHQLSREINKGQNRGKDVRPVAQDLSDGGDKGADTIFIIRHNEEKTQSYNNCVKNRQGISGRRSMMKFHGERMRFEDVEEQEMPEGFKEEIPDDVYGDFVETYGEEQILLDN